MNTPVIDDPIWVDTPLDLHNMIQALQDCKKVAVDTESNSLFAYQEQVCLIQFSTGSADYLVDPLAFDDLTALGPIFADPAIEKIFHAAEYDIICLKRDFGFSFENLFDTMLAARILGVKEIGLAAILENEFGVTLDKRFQRANWGARPLPADQLDYARMDTHYLIPLSQRLHQRLTDKGFRELAHEDFSRLTHVHANNQENGLGHFWRLAGKSDLNPKQTAILYELYEYRDRIAQSLNRPVFKVLSDTLLLGIAEQIPRNQDALERIRGANRNILRRHGDKLLAAVEKGQREKPPQKPTRHYPNGRYLILHDTLRNWRKDTARQQGVESDIVLPRDVLESIAREEPQNIQQLELLMADLPWRFNAYGTQILNTIRSLEAI